jgi:hypothetical protein
MVGSRACQHHYDHNTRTSTNSPKIRETTYRFFPTMVEGCFCCGRDRTIGGCRFGWGRQSGIGGGGGGATVFRMRCGCGNDDVDDNGNTITDVVSSVSNDTNRRGGGGGGE